MKALVVNVHENSSTTRQQQCAPNGIVQIQVLHGSNDQLLVNQGPWT